MPTSPGLLIAALEALWRRIQEAAPELPPAPPTVSPTRSRQNHDAERWTINADGTVSGLVIHVDTLSAGAEATVYAVLHEAAHVLNLMRDVSDTTMRGAYHTQAYLTAAQEVGLEWPDDVDRSTTKGYSAVVLSDGARARYARDLAELEAIIPGVLPHLAPIKSPRASRTPDRLTMVCKCTPPRTFRISQTIEAAGPITCGVCGMDFTVK
ncbi:hypothetical protein ABTY96_03350 [Streptomyces sp. NPDC096057]|uniref:hypothetical protein n=1 Tax=Streptomyces sp. NPDC096057 TaxID=3155543 RepID=UPI0033280889